MSVAIDTDILIYFLKGHESVVANFVKTSSEEIQTTIINQSELLFGAFNSAHKNRNLEIISNFLSKVKILPFCDKAAYVFAEQKALLKKDGSLLADMDLMIASICLVHHMPLVTNNEKHFSRLKKLKIQNWASG